MVYVERKLFFTLAQITNVQSSYYKDIFAKFLPKLEQIITESDGGKDYVQKYCTILLKRTLIPKEFKALVFCFPAEIELKKIDEFTDNVQKFYASCITSKLDNHMLELQSFPFNDIIDDQEFLYNNNENVDPEDVSNVFLLLSNKGVVLNHFNV